MNRGFNPKGTAKGKFNKPFRTYGPKTSYGGSAKPGSSSSSARNYNSYPSRHNARPPAPAHNHNGTLICVVCGQGHNVNQCPDRLADQASTVESFSFSNVFLIMDTSNSMEQGTYGAEDKQHANGENIEPTIEAMSENLGDHETDAPMVPESPCHHPKESTGESEMVNMSGLAGDPRDQTVKGVDLEPDFDPDETDRLTGMERPNLPEVQTEPTEPTLAKRGFTQDLKDQSIHRSGVATAFLASSPKDLIQVNFFSPSHGGFQFKINHLATFREILGIARTGFHSSDTNQWDANGKLIIGFSINGMTVNLDQSAYSAGFRDSTKTYSLTCMEAAWSDKPENEGRNANLEGLVVDGHIKPEMAMPGYHPKDDKEAPYRLEDFTGCLRLNRKTYKYQPGYWEAKGYWQDADGLWWKPKKGKEEAPPPTPKEPKVQEDEIDEETALNEGFEIIDDEVGYWGPEDQDGNCIWYKLFNLKKPKVSPKTKATSASAPRVQYKPIYAKSKGRGKQSSKASYGGTSKSDENDLEWNKWTGYKSKSSASDQSSLGEEPPKYTGYKRLILGQQHKAEKEQAKQRDEERARRRSSASPGPKDREQERRRPKERSPTPERTAWMRPKGTPPNWAPTLRGSKTGDTPRSEGSEGSAKRGPPKRDQSGPDRKVLRTKEEMSDSYTYESESDTPPKPKVSTTTTKPKAEDKNVRGARPKSQQTASRSNKMPPPKELPAKEKLKAKPPKEESRGRTEERPKDESPSGRESSASRVIPLMVINFDGTVCQTKYPKDYTWIEFASIHTAEFKKENPVTGKSFIILANGHKVRMTAKLEDSMQKGKTFVVEIVSGDYEAKHITTVIDLMGLEPCDIDPMDPKVTDITHLAGNKEAMLQALKGETTSNDPKDLFTVLDVFSSEEIQEGLILVDSGASETVGSPEALTALVNKAFTRHNSKVRVLKRSDGPRFRMANGAITKTYSQLFLETPMGTFSAYCMEGTDVPILMSIKALRALDAVIDFSSDEMSFALTKPNGQKSKRITRKLTKSPKGHLLFDLLDDTGLDG